MHAISGMHHIARGQSYTVIPVAVRVRSTKLDVFSRSKLARWEEKQCPSNVCDKATQHHVKYQRVRSIPSRTWSRQGCAPSPFLFNKGLEIQRVKQAGER